MMSTAAAAGEGVRNNGDGGRFPFTASQWQELEHQALVYKYIISGIPIPPDLLFTIKTSLDSSILRHHPPHPSVAVGWNWGFGRKIDPEPGRCRRTDGKKWRCSKEAYPDSKYCERHMHRGRNRSRKPVEVNIKTTPSIPSTKSPNYPSPNSHPLSTSDFLYNNNNNNNPTHLISSFNVLSPQDHFLLDSNPYSRRKSYGMNEEHPFFSESSAGTIKTSVSDSWQLSMNNSYPYQQQDHGYYDQLALKIDRKDDEPQKVMHHFFDEWPPNKDSSTTQLSISIPNSAHDFFLQTHNNHNDN